MTKCVLIDNLLLLIHSETKCTWLRSLYLLKVLILLKQLESMNQMIGLLKFIYNKSHSVGIIAKKTCVKI